MTKQGGLFGWLRKRNFLWRMAAQSELIKFAQRAYSLKDRPVFAVLTLVLFLLPGSNYYMDITLTASEPRIRRLSISLPAASRYPVADPSIKPPVLTARSAIAVDVGSASILFAKNPDEPLLPASTTKIMTALVALNHYPLEKIITVKQADRAIGQTMNLVPGEEISVESLLYGLLLESGNDAAFALAEQFPGGYSAFVDEMNFMAKTLHLTNTQFRNVSGVEQVGHYSTVRDLARLAAVAMRNPVFSRVVSTRETVVTSADGKIFHRLINKNLLLDEVQGTRGVKTGWTEHAGECLVTDTIRDGNEVIVVILGSSYRFAESASLIEWAYRAHTWQEPQVVDYWAD